VAGLSVDGWQPNEDAVMTQSQRLVSSMLSDTAVLALAHHHADVLLEIDVFLEIHDGGSRHFENHKNCNISVMV